MDKKSQAFYRFCQDMANQQLSYYDSSEIEDAANDLLDMEMVNDAIYLLEEGLKMHPDEESIEKYLIWAYAHNHQLSKAEQMFEKYRDEQTDWSIRMDFTISVLHGQPKQALEVLNQKFLSKAISSKSFTDSIDEMFDSIPHSLLTPYLNVLADQEDQTSDSLGRIGCLLIEIKEYQAAVNVLEKALDKDAYDIYSWQDLARCQLLLENFDKAIESCEYGLAIDEKNPLLNFIIGYSLFQQNEQERAIPYLEIIRNYAEGKLTMPHTELPEEELRHNYIISYDLLGHCYMESEKNTEAIECFKALIQLCPDEIKYYVDLATTLLAIGDINGAEKAIDQALEQEPSDIMLSSLKISILIEKKKYNDAMKVMKDVIDLEPEKMSFQLTYAALAQKTGQTELAEEAYSSLFKCKKIGKMELMMLKGFFESIDNEDGIARVNQKIKELESDDTDSETQTES